MHTSTSRSAATPAGTRSRSCAIASERVRAGVVIVDGTRVALIRRVREGMTYFTFPGGGADAGETVEQAASREALEELGVEVALDGLAAELEFAGERQVYFRARIVGGEFGAGSWPDHERRSDLEREKRGTYQPVWIDVCDLSALDVRPRELVPLLAP